MRGFRERAILAVSSINILRTIASNNSLFRNFIPNQDKLMSSSIVFSPLRPKLGMMLRCKIYNLRVSPALNELNPVSPRLWYYYHGVKDTVLIAKIAPEPALKLVFCLGGN